LSLCTGDLIGIVNSDDIYKPNALKIINKYIKKNPTIDFIFGSVKKHWGVLHGYKPEKIKYSWGFYSSHSTGFFIKTKSAKKVGLYNLKYKYHADYDFFYRMIVKYKMLGIASKKNESLGTFRPGGMSEKLHWIKILLIESKIRIKNNQNFIFVILLFLLNLLNRFKYKVIGIFR
jgi:hypothetical protein